MTTTITRDQILASQQASLYEYIVHYGQEAMARVLSVDEDDTGYAVSFHTHQLIRFRRTGEVVRKNMVTVAVEVAQDTGDQAGTLAFDSALSLRGKVNRAVFGM